MPDDNRPPTLDDIATQADALADEYETKARDILDGDGAYGGRLVDELVEHLRNLAGRCRATQMPPSPLTSADAPWSTAGQPHPVAAERARLAAEQLPTVGRWAEPDTAASATSEDGDSNGGKPRTPFRETEVLLDVLEGRQEDALDRIRAFTPDERQDFLVNLRRTEAVVNVATELDG